MAAAAAAAAGLSWSDNGADCLWARDDLSVSRFQAMTNSTSASINEEKFASAKSIRTSTIILACVNLLAALATAAIILWDSYKRSWKSNATFRFRFTTTGFVTIRPRDQLPLILSAGIFIQSIVFAAVQSMGLQALLVLGCAGASQIMFPATFLVPYLQLVLGLETTLRTLRSGPSRPQGRWSVIICLSVVAGLLVLHSVATIFIRPPNLCFASLFWFLERYATACFGLFLAIVLTAIMATATLSLKLMRDAKMDLSGREAASGMVYHMVIAVVSNTLLLPFFYSLAFLDQRDVGPRTLRLSLLAAVAANISGLTTGCLYLFLRYNLLATIGPKDDNDNDDDDTTSDGVDSPPGTGSRSSKFINVPPPLRKTSSTDFLVVRGNQEEEAMIESPIVPTSIGTTSTYEYNYSLSSGQRTPAGQREGDIMVDLVPDSAPPTPSSTYPPTRGFPSVQPPSLLPATTYAPYASTTPGQQYPEQGLGDFLAPPPPVLGPGSMYWRRSSMSSSATVQIGLRFSNVEDVPPMTSRYFQDSNQVYSIGDFDEKPVLALPNTKRPSPLVATAAVDSDLISPRAPSSVYDEDEILLNSNVYSPRSPTRVKLTSPRGVGFKQPQPPPKKPWI